MHASCSCHDRKRNDTPAGRRASPRRAPGSAIGNQARLRAKTRARCASCEEGEHAQARSQSVPADAGTAPAAGGVPAATTPTRATSVDVWGLRVDRSMCRCRDRIRENIAWSNEAARTYAACNTPANALWSDVEACFGAAHPEAVVIATTSSSGVVTLPAASTDPCERIDNKATFVHEIMHARHTDAMALARGPAFNAAWRALAGAPNRLDQLRVRFPAEVAAFEAQWDSGDDWARDEVHSYTWERRFYDSALQALKQIC